jgi:hypothetical protein
MIMLIKTVLKLRKPPHAMVSPATLKYPATAADLKSCQAKKEQKDKMNKDVAIFLRDGVAVRNAILP